MAALGVTDHRLARRRGQVPRLRDDGHRRTTTTPTCFWRADLLAAATDLVAVIREVRPQVLVTYDDFGGYGHPDHIQAHRVATYAAVLAAAPSFRPELGEAWEIAKIYWTRVPEGRSCAQGIEALQAAGDTSDFARMDPDDLPVRRATTTLVTHGDRRRGLLRARRWTRCAPTPPRSASRTASSRCRTTWAREALRASSSTASCAASAGGARDDEGRETDLFAGLSAR